MYVLIINIFFFSGRFLSIENADALGNVEFED